MDNQEIIRKLNEMLFDEQVKHFKTKCKEFGWEIYEDLNKEKRNFHVCINNEFIKQIKCWNFVNYLGKRFQFWSIYTNKKRIDAQYGDIINLLVNTLNKKGEENGQQ